MSHCIMQNEKLKGLRLNEYGSNKLYSFIMLMIQLEDMKEAIISFEWFGKKVTETEFNITKCEGFWIG